jgi:hypothetical protein
MSSGGPKGVSINQILAAIEQTGTQSGAAALLGINKRGLERRLQSYREGRAIEQKYGELPPPPELPEGEILKGRSYMRRNEEGMPEWIKTNADAQEQLNAFKEAAEALKEDLKPLPRIKQKIRHNNDLLNLFVLTDAHIGMLAWGEETGTNWDTKIAEETIMRFFQAAIDNAPPARRAVFAQMGDFLHFDGIESVTPTNKHQLDTDTRFAELVRVGIRVTRRIIEMLLTKYVTVEVIMAEGNHDETTEIWLRESFADRYLNQPRLFIDQSPAPFYAVEHGSTSLFFHHGHLKKIDEVDRTMASEFRELFGRTRHSYCHLGHLHHWAAKESELMTVERHGTLSARDSYASRHGYSAARQAQVITYHADHGYVGRQIITPEMLES